MLYNLIRPLLFCLDAEFSHNLTLGLLKTGYQLGCYRTKPHFKTKAVNCFGLNFPSQVGLAAGLDKNAECIPAWGAMGFGFVEVGTITPKAQPGNPRPRLFRLPKNKAIINRMGFNNKGVDYLIERVKSLPKYCPLGINIGKNKDTPLENAADDYLSCFQKVYAFADYVTVNLSSPNTPGLKSLQHGEQLNNILKPLTQERERLAQSFQKHVPIVVKISADLVEDEIKHICDHLLAAKIDGVIATNTTIARPSFLQGKACKEEGGLSGEPLFDASTAVVKTIYRHAAESLPIIAVGGISTLAQAKAKLDSGAKLIQIYTGLIYQGPKLIRELSTGLA